MLRPSDYFRGHLGGNKLSTSSQWTVYRTPMISVDESSTLSGGSGSRVVEGLPGGAGAQRRSSPRNRDRKSTRLNSSHGYISYAVFCLKKKKDSSHTAHHVVLIYLSDHLVIHIDLSVEPHPQPPQATRGLSALTTHDPQAHAPAQIRRA